MIAERIQQPNNSYAATTKYYQFSTILEHVIDCFHTIVTDESNPYHPPLAWLTRKQPKPPDDELFLDVYDECSKPTQCRTLSNAISEIQLSSSVRLRLEKCPQQLRQEIVSRTRDGCSPLFIACKNGLTRIVKYLLDVCGADIEQRGRYEAFEDHHVHSVSPIWVAAVSGHLDTVKLLIDRKANINSISDTGSTPLRSVCFLCKDDDGIEEYDNFLSEYSFGDPDLSDDGDVYMKIALLLIDSGADMKLPNYNGGTCLINSLHNYRLANIIISRGADVDARDNNGKVALHYAVQQNKLAMVKLLLANGANPHLRTQNNDDALRLSCIGGHEEIFEYLIESYSYDQKQLSDAYKLIGSSILEIHYDLARVRKYWIKAITIDKNLVAALTTTTAISPLICDNRRLKAFGDMDEFYTETRLQALSVDDFRIQSLIITERVLGSSHRETIQRLLYRGTFYINSLRPGRCLDLWIYALKLRLEHDSIFHFESIFAAQAITKLFLDLFGQHRQQQVRYDDVRDVLSLLIGRIDECQHHLSFMPRSCLHEDIYDLLLSMIVNLMLIMRCIQRKRCQIVQTNTLTAQLVGLNPKTTNNSSLLHLCVAPNIFEGDIYRSIMMASESSTSVDANTSEGLRCRPMMPVIELIKSLIDAGLNVDSINEEGLSAMQVLCLATSIRVSDKTRIVELLIERGAHVDRRAGTPEQGEQIRQTLRECGIKPIGFITLKCLASRRVAELKLPFDKATLAANLNESIAIH